MDWYARSASTGPIVRRNGNWKAASWGKLFRARLSPAWWRRQANRFARLRDMATVKITASRRDIPRINQYRFCRQVEQRLTRQDAPLYLSTDHRNIESDAILIISGPNRGRESAFLNAPRLRKRWHG